MCKLLRFCCAFGAFLYKIGGLTALAAVEYQPAKDMDRIVPVVVLQLAIMNHSILIRFDDEILAR